MREIKRHVHYETKCGRKCQREHVVDHTLDHTPINALEWFGTAFEESDTLTHQRKVCDKATTKGALLRKWWRFGELCVPSMLGYMEVWYIINDPNT